LGGLGSPGGGGGGDEEGWRAYKIGQCAATESRWGGWWRRWGVFRRGGTLDFSLDSFGGDPHALHVRRAAFRGLAGELPAPVRLGAGRCWRRRAGRGRIGQTGHESGFGGQPATGEAIHPAGMGLAFGCHPALGLDGRDGASFAQFAATTGKGAWTGFLREKQDGFAVVVEGCAIALDGKVGVRQVGGVAHGASEGLIMAGDGGKTAWVIEGEFHGRGGGGTPKMRGWV
jgi:hypothetical protein